MDTWRMDQPLILAEFGMMNPRRLVKTPLPRNGDGKISQDELKMVLHNSEAQ